ncbi:hypothetical protein [Salinispora arenicola]|uniref:hypothetical protein n=1 Tax=Salinispora arenicola TaxID=168697 RepID=UPI002079DB2D|nr:hypothetical protein [Salinispora arenicola]MCN0154003.1 hypothetical protein [Salinispora arenicola]
MRFAACLVSLLLISGCGVLLPSHDYYAVGVAQIGDRLYVYAPLCDGERVVGVEAYDNLLAAQEPDYDPASMQFTYWKAQDPTDESVANGWIALGDSNGFRTTAVVAGSNIELPEFMGISLQLDVGSQHVVGDVVSVSEAPRYPAGADPGSVRYAYRSGGDGEDTRDPSKIRDESGCAADYPA